MPNQTCQSKTNLATQAYWAKPTKPNPPIQTKLLGKAVDAWVRSAFGNVWIFLYRQRIKLCVNYQPISRQKKIDFLLFSNYMWDTNPYRGPFLVSAWCCWSSMNKFSLLHTAWTYLGVFNFFASSSLLLPSSATIIVERLSLSLIYFTGSVDYKCLSPSSPHHWSSRITKKET